MQEKRENTFWARMKKVFAAIWHMIAKVLGFVLRPLINLISPVFTPIFRLCYYVGAVVVLSANRMKRRAVYYGEHIQKYCKRLVRKTKRALKRGFGAVTSEIEGFGKQVEKLRYSSKKEAQEQVGDEEKKPSLWVRMRASFRAVKNNPAAARRIFNYVLPVLALCVFCGVLVWGSTLSFALEVRVRGQFIGYIDNESVFETADKNLQKRIVYNDGEDILYNIPVYSVAIVSRDDVNSANEITDNLIAASGEEFVQATGLYVNDKLIGATTEGEELKAYLQGLLDEHASGEPNEEVTFQKDIQTVDGLFLAGSLMSYDDLYDKISGNAIEDVVYTVVAGDTPSGIASANGMTMDELYAMNRDTMDSPTDMLHVGQKLLLQRAQPYLAVQVVRTISYTEVIEHGTKEVNNSSYYVGTRRVTQYGRNGEAAVTAKVTYINGVETNTTIVSREVTSEPVDEVVQVGTRVQLANGGSVDIGDAQGSGSYVWPVQGGAYNYVSCEMYGYYGHTGMDIAAPNGTPIVAVDSGVVTVASRLYMNGLYIVINHGNGLQTLYAHCSQLLVSPGQKVEKGQLIGRVGMTGNASGYHLHIEFIQNGVFRNPRNYLGWR